MSMVQGMACMRLRSILHCSALGVAIVCSPAFAQEIATDAVAPRSLTVGMGAGAVFDTNVADSNEALAQARHLSREDELGQLNLNVNGVLPVGRQSLFLNTAAGYDFYNHNHVLNSERLDVTAGLNARLSSCVSTASVEYMKNRTALLDLIGPGLGGTGNIRNFESDSTATISAACGRSVGFRPSLTVSGTNSTNSASLRSPLDHNLFSVVPGISYARPSLGSIQLYGQYVDLSYIHLFDVPEVVPTVPPSLGFVSVRNGYKVYAGGLRYNRQIGSRLVGGFSVAYTSLEPISSISQPFSGLTYTGDLSYHLGSRVDLHLAANHGPLPSNQIAAASYYVDEKWAVDGSYHVGSRVTLKAGVSRETEKYNNADFTRVSNLIAKERLDSVFGSSSVALGRRLSLLFEARYSTRKANLEFYDYNSSRMTLTLNAAF